MKILKRSKRYVAIALTLAVAVIMMINATPVHAEGGVAPEWIEGVQSDINIISTNQDTYYQVRYYNNYSQVIYLTSIINDSCVFNLEQYKLMVGEKVIIHYGASADNLDQAVEVDPTVAVFNLDEFLSGIDEETPPLMEGIVDSIKIINSNSDFYYSLSIHHYNGSMSYSHLNYTYSLNVNELELRVGDKVLLQYIDKVGRSQQIELDLTKEVFNFDEYLSYDTDDEISIQLTVASSYEAAKSTQFYLCIGDTYYTGEVFKTSESEALVFTGSMNETFKKRNGLNGSVPFIQLLDENKTVIQFETLEDGNLFINLDNYVKQDDGKKPDDNKKADDGKKPDDNKKANDGKKPDNKTSPTTTATSTTPKTGDESSPLLAIFGMLSGLGVIGICLLKGKKSKE